MTAWFVVDWKMLEKVHECIRHDLIGFSLPFVMYALGWWLIRRANKK